MNNISSSFSHLQQTIDKHHEGMLLRVQLANKDELNILLDDMSSAYQTFIDIVNQSCANKQNYTIIVSQDPSLIYIVMPNDKIAAEDLAYSIYSQVQLYIDKNSPESYLKCCISSISFLNNLGKDAEKLISKMAYIVSNFNTGCYYYNYDDYQIDLENIREENKNLSFLRNSLISRKARFAYQPIINSINKKVEYYECLLRVMDVDGEYMSVGPLIKNAEKKGLIHIVDWTVMKMVVKELEDNSDLKLSVNISNIGVLNKRLLSKIEKLLKNSKVADRLIIEITETTLNVDFVNTKKFIDVLHKYGCKFALDDFGSGFTSFKQLLKLPIDIIKIDGSYIRDILNNDQSKFFVESLVKIANDMGIKTVAEFVENEDIATLLEELKVSSMQGNYFLPASAKKMQPEI